MKKIIFLLVLCFIVGCGDSGSSKAALPDAYFDISGTWNGSMTGIAATSFVLVVSQTDNDLVGMMSNNIGWDFDVTGSVHGDTVNLWVVKFPADGYAASISGQTDGFTASGTWSDNDGNSGTWSATK